MLWIYSLHGIHREVAAGPLTESLCNDISALISAFGPVYPIIYSLCELGPGTIT